MCFSVRAGEGGEIGDVRDALSAGGEGFVHEISVGLGFCGAEFVELRLRGIGHAERGGDGRAAVGACGPAAVGQVAAAFGAFERHRLPVQAQDYTHGGNAFRLRSGSKNPPIE